MQPLSDLDLPLLEALEEAEGVDALLDFIPFASPWYLRPDHLRPLAEIFWRAEREPVRALTSTPPQHGKSESILHWCARFIKRNPRKVVAYATYAAEIAQDKSKTCRDIAYRIGVDLRDDSHSAKTWRTREGGGFLATGVGGPLTGQRVDLLVIDDPTKGRQDAESSVFQRRLMDWAKSTAFTRLTKDGSVILNMARWSVGDLIGRLPVETDEKWEVVNIPAIFDPGGPNERALWEAVKPLDFLKRQKRIIGDYDWAALFEGRPQPKGGALFRPPSRYSAFMDIKNARFAIACDPAASAKTSADHSAIAVVAATGDGIDQKVYVLEIWRGQVEIPALVEKLRLVQERWRCPIWVESVGGFKAVAQVLRSIGGKKIGDDPRDPLRIVEVPALGDKFTRALPLSASWNDGRVLIPEAAQNWSPAFLDEILSFTGKGDRQDDQVDALVHAFAAVDRRVPAIVRGVQAVRGMV